MEQLARQHRDRVKRTIRPAEPAQPTEQRPGLRPVTDALLVEIADPAGRRKVEAGIAAVTRVHSVEGLPRIPVRETTIREDEGRFVPRPKRGGGGLTADSILVNVSKWRPDWIVVHEIGHFLDLDGLTSSGYYTSEQEPGGRAWELVQAIVRELMETTNCRLIGKLREEVAERGDKAAIEQTDYLLEPKEMFARAYAQYIAWRSADDVLFERLDRLLTHENPRWRLRQWPHAQYLPLVERFDTLFESLGWLTRLKNA